MGDQFGRDTGRGFPRRAVAAVVIVTSLVLATVAGAWLVRQGQLGGRSPAGSGAAAPAPPVYSTVPTHFDTLAPGSRLPSGGECAQLLRPRDLPETKAVNARFNLATGHALARNFFNPDSHDPKANTAIAARVDGAFTGTTHQILRWAACKWGIDEDIVYAQAAKESWWRQNSMGDWHADPGGCAPGHGLGVDGRPGLCPQSFGIVQNRYPFERSSWPGISDSTAMNADTAYAIWRACFEGYERWLNTMERGRAYGAGDAWGCVGRWVSGRWHTPLSEQYIAGVQNYESRRVWEQRDFIEL